MNATLVATLGSGGIVGFTLGLVGGGGSILAVPLLLYAVGVANPHVAIGTSAVAVSVNAFAISSSMRGQGMSGGAALPFSRCSVLSRRSLPRRSARRSTGSFFSLPSGY